MRTSRSTAASGCGVRLCQPLRCTAQQAVRTVQLDPPGFIQQAVQLFADRGERPGMHRLHLVRLAWFLRGGRSLLGRQPRAGIRLDAAIPSVAARLAALAQPAGAAISRLFGVASIEMSGSPESANHRVTGSMQSIEPPPNSLGSEPVFRAAHYVRMSTEHQQYSTENQPDKIPGYAARRIIEIVRSYADAGKSGLRIDGAEMAAQTGRLPTSSSRGQGTAATQPGAAMATAQDATPPRLPCAAARP